MQSLNGTWDFAFADNPQARPVNFWEVDADRSKFTTIEVPSEIEFQDFSQINYINTLYPWSGKIYRRPAYAVGDDEAAGSFSQGADNTVGAYVRKFDLPLNWQGLDVHVMYEGVERAVYVWLNGHFIGYAEDSFTPSEFDLTPYLQNKNNVLAVEVFKHSTASWLEGQDMFRFSGIFRDVSLVAIPASHVVDLKVDAPYDPASQQGQIGLAMQVTGEADQIQVALADPDGEVIFETSLTANDQWELPLRDLETVQAWDNHQPVLYQLTLTVIKDGEIQEVIPQVVGFR